MLFNLCTVSPEGPNLRLFQGFDGGAFVLYANIVSYSPPSHTVLTQRVKEDQLSNYSSSPRWKLKSGRLIIRIESKSESLRDKIIRSSNECGLPFACPSCVSREGTLHFSISSTLCNVTDFRELSFAPFFAGWRRLSVGVHERPV